MSRDNNLFDETTRKHHLTLLAEAFYRYLRFDDKMEYGAWTLDCKRPFGSSYVEDDILEFVGVSPEGDEKNPEYWSDAQREYAHNLYLDLGDHVKELWQELKSLRAAFSARQAEEAMVRFESDETASPGVHCPRCFKTVAPKPAHLIFGQGAPDDKAWEYLQCPICEIPLILLIANEAGECTLSFSPDTQ